MSTDSRPKIPGWVMPITLFLTAELGGAIWLVADLRAEVRHLREEIQALKDTDTPARLARLEERVGEHRRRLDDLPPKINARKSVNKALHCAKLSRELLGGELLWLS